MEDEIEREELQHGKRGTEEEGDDPAVGDPGPEEGLILPPLGETEEGVDAAREPGGEGDSARDREKGFETVEHGGSCGL